MDNSIDEIKIRNKNNYITTPYYRINKILSLQIINIILVILLLFICINKNNISLYKDNNYINHHKENHKKNILEKLKLLKILTNNDELEYKGLQECLINDPDEKFCIYHLILPKVVVGKKRVLLGEKNDGCYVLIDDFENIKFAYSFGIFKNIQFDKALADKGIDVYMYDHTINSLPYENPKFHWKKIGICGANRNLTNMKTLEQLIEENGHINEKNMILKMDIEHWEWEAILNLKEETLKQFKYIAVEYHFEDKNYYKDEHLYYNVIKKISKTHQAFYARCNGDRSKKINFGNNRICFIMEVSYIIKKGNLFKKDETVYPIYEFDYSKPVIGKLEMNLNLLKLFNDDS